MGVVGHRRLVAQPAGLILSFALHLDTSAALAGVPVLGLVFSVC